jgi:uncharacterized protein (TIGR00251 family)
VDRHFRICKDGIELFVRLTPKAHRDAVEGIEATAGGRTHVKARVRAVAEKGRANKALEALLAKYLGLPKSAVEIKSGSTSRLKTVAISGNIDDIKNRLRDLKPAQG